MSSRASYINGQILFREYAPDDELPGAGSFILQGVAVGALVSFVSSVSNMLMQAQNDYNFLYMALLPFFLAGGMLFGALVGIIIWACTHIDGHRLNVLVRSCLSIGVLAAFLAAYVFLYSTRAPYY